MFETQLLSVPTSEWIIDRVVVLDWYDGPRQGFCALAHPSVDFVFDVVDEIYKPDGLDMRIMQLKELSTGSVGRLIAELTQLGWGSAGITPEADARAREIIDALENRAEQTCLLIASTDMKQITACWRTGTQPPATVAIASSFPVASEPTAQHG
jgi:hypothetical protein